MILRLALIATLVVVLMVGLLYAYRAQSPIAQQIPTSAALAEIQQDKVRVILIEDGQATLTPTDGTKQGVTTGDQGNELARAATDRNQAQPTRPIELRYVNGPMLGFSGFAIVPSLLLPILLVVVIVLAAKTIVRSRASVLLALRTHLAGSQGATERGVAINPQLTRRHRLPCAQRRRRNGIVGNQGSEEASVGESNVSASPRPRCRRSRRPSVRAAARMTSAGHRPRRGDRPRRRG